MTIKELLVLFKFDVDDASFAYAQSLLNKMEEKASGLEQQSNKDDYFDGVGKGANKASLGVNALIGRMRMLAGLAGISLTINGLIQTADQWRTIEGQVKNVIGEEEKLEDIQERLYQVAGRTRQSYAQTAGLFTSVSRSASELGKSTDEILAFTEDVAMALRAGGGNADSQAAALVQLGQALGSGALRGDELNSILEQAPVLANTIAQGMGTSIGQLRRLGREGKITSAIIFESVRKMHDNLVRQTANAPLTMNAAFLRVRDAFSRVIFRLEKNFGVVNKLAESVASVADLIDKVNVDVLIAGLKLSAFWAGMIYIYLNKAFLVSKVGMFLNGLGMIVGFLMNIYNGMRYILGLQFASQTARYMGIVGSTLIKASLAVSGIVALITIAVLALEDLYQWLNGNDSLIGDMLGGMSGAERWSQWVTEFKASLKQLGELGAWFWDILSSGGGKAFDALLWLMNAIFAVLKATGMVFIDFIGWINDLFNKIDEVQSWVTGKKLGFWENNSVDAARLVSDGANVANNRNINNSGNTTNHINITAPNGTAEAYAQAISNVLPGSPSYDFAMD